LRTHLPTPKEARRLVAVLSWHRPSVSVPVRILQARLEAQTSDDGQKDQGSKQISGPTSKGTPGVKPVNQEVRHGHGRADVLEEKKSFAKHQLRCSPMSERKQLPHVVRKEARRENAEESDRRAKPDRSVGDAQQSQEEQHRAILVNGLRCASNSPSPSGWV
jgi:hypothetical protein